MLNRRILTTVFALVFAGLCGIGASVSAQTGGLKGTVRANNGGSIAASTVSIRKDGREVKRVTSDSKGRFVIEGVEAGSYTVLFDANGFQSGVLYNVEVKDSKTRDLGDRLILFPDQGSQVIIKGSVFNPDGRSITGAKIEIERVESDGTTRKIGNALTTISGEFTFRQPKADATYRVTAKFKGASGSKDIPVTNAAIYRLAITLQTAKAN